MFNKYLAELSKEQLLELIELYAKNWLAHDGVWFQSLTATGSFTATMTAAYRRHVAARECRIIRANRLAFTNTAVLRRRLMTASNAAA